MNNNVLQEARQDSLKNLDDNSLSTLGMRCQDLRDVNSQIKDLEEQLKDLKESERKLSEEIIPAILHEKNLSSVVLKDGTKGTTKVEYRARIKDEYKEFCFNWLRQNNYGDLIKNNFNIVFNMGDDAKTKALKEFIARQGLNAEHKEDVHWKTLSAFAEEQTVKGVSLPEEFGLYVSNKTKLV